MDENLDGVRVLRNRVHAIISYRVFDFGSWQHSVLSRRARGCSFGWRPVVLWTKSELAVNDDERIPERLLLGYAAAYHALDLQRDPDLALLLF